jgi:hypothetical protein
LCPLVSLHVPSCPLVSLHVPSCPLVSLHVPSCPLVSLRVPSCPFMSPRVPSCPLVNHVVTNSFAVKTICLAQSASLSQSHPLMLKISKTCTHQSHTHTQLIQSHPHSISSWSTCCSVPPHSPTQLLNHY